MTSSIPCPNCGRLNRPGARYCASCQSPLGGATAAPLRPGQLLKGGAYRVVRPLGKGGMGAVWLVAQTEAFDRLAVLKEVIEYFDPVNAEERQQALARFEAEARTLGDLKHPGIPDLYAYFSEGGHNYLVMEYIEGPDLRHSLTHVDGDTGQIVPGSPLPAEQVLHYTIEICQVLEYLAGRQPPVVHNDIKPANILIDRHSGRAVLVDFGTAKTRYLRTAGQPGSVYGTVGYAAPELYQGRSEPRSDVYSLAATAYHLLTDDDPGDHPGRFPQLEALPPALAGILQAALAEKVEERLTATRFRQQLEEYLAGLTGPLRALAFPDGDAADERDELLSLAVKHWNYAAGLLHDGTLARWLRNVLRDPVAAQAAEAAVQQWPTSPDAALDAFIRQLNPSALPPGQMELRTASLYLPELEPDRQVVRQIEVFNRGRGYLHGEMLSTQPWLKTGRTFACPPGQVCAIPIEIDTAGLQPGQPHLAAVTLIPVGGPPEVVAVQIAVRGEKGAPVRIGPAAPVLAVSPERVDLGAVSRRNQSAIGKVTVTNIGPTAVQVRVQGMPSWLEARPPTFLLVTGAKQVVKLVGQAGRLRAGEYKATLTFAAGAAPDQAVEVVLRVRGGGLFG